MSKASNLAGFATSIVPPSNLSVGVVTATSFIGNLTGAAGSAGAPTIQIGTGTTIKPGIYSSGTDQLAFSTGGTGRIFIDSSGNVAVGASATRSYYIDGVATTPRVDVSGANAIPFALYRSTFTPYLVIARGDTPAAGQAISGVSFNGYDGADLRESARVTCVRDGTWSSGATPGALVFSTTADGAASPTERMRIDSGGNCLIGTTSRLSNTNAGLHVAATGGSTCVFQQTSQPSDVLSVWNAGTSGDNVFVGFYTEGTATTRGSIDYNRSAGQVRYNVTSDRRLKSDIQLAGTALNTLSAIQVRSYKWAETGYRVDYGFIAQELNEVAPDAVKVGDDGEEVADTWAVDNGKLVPLLTKALQEAIAKIETLEAKVAALESA